MEAAFAQSVTLRTASSSQCVSIHRSATSPLIRPWRQPVSPSRCIGPKMAAESSIAKKAEKVKAVEDALAESLLVFAVPLSGLTVQQKYTLKEKMPEGTKMMTVKNTLMRRAIANTPWESASGLTKQSSIWVFVKEDMKNTVKVYKDYMKEISREGEIRGGVFEGEPYDSKGVDSIAALPNKKELITKIAIAIKAVPTKIARSINLVPTKVGRVVKLAFAEEKDGSSDGSGDAPPAE